MKSIVFSSSNENPSEVAILIKSSGLNKNKIETYYIKPTNVNLDLFQAWELEYDNPKKASAKRIKEHLLDLLPEIEYAGIKTLFVADGPYFKQLTGVGKVDPFYGEILPCNIKGYEHIKVILSINYQALVYNPLLQGKLDRSLVALKNHITGKKITSNNQIIHRAEYPKTIPELLVAIEKLKTYSSLTCDIETKSLEFWNAGLSTISFAWNKHEGIAFAIDRNSTEDFGFDNPIKRFIRGLLLQFFEDYKGILIFHNASYDMKVLVYELWMNHLADYPGMLKGIFTLTKNFHDTKLIIYLATNNAIENSLGLKENSAEFTGNYAEDTTDTSIIPIQDLLVYNLQDCLATWYVAEKYWPVMIRDEQKSVYDTIMKPSVKSLLAMELCGMPINPQKVQAAKTQLSDIVNIHVNFFRNNSHIKEVHYQLLQIKADSYTAKAKKKVYTIDDLVVRKDLEEFNPGSDNQVRYLLYDYFGLPEIDYTDSKLPATGGKTLKKLINHTQNKDIVEIIENLRGYADASKILTTFIPAFENAQQLPDGSWRLYGNFNLGGTQSLRLSSSNP